MKISEELSLIRWRIKNIRRGIVRRRRSDAEQRGQNAEDLGRGRILSGESRGDDLSRKKGENTQEILKLLGDSTYDAPRGYKTGDKSSGWLESLRGAKLELLVSGERFLRGLRTTGLKITMDKMVRYI